MCLQRGTVVDKMIQTNTILQRKSHTYCTVYFINDFDISFDSYCSNRHAHTQYLQSHSFIAYNCIGTGVGLSWKDKVIRLTISPSHRPTQPKKALTCCCPFVIGPVIFQHESTPSPVKSISEVDPRQNLKLTYTSHPILQGRGGAKSPKSGVDFRSVTFQSYTFSET